MDEKSIEKILGKLLDQKLSPLNDNLSRVSMTMRKIEESMEFLSKKYDELLSKVDVLESEKEVLMKDNTILKSDLKNLSREMSTVNNNLNDMEQYSTMRRECLEIRGIPVRDQHDENTNATVKNVSKLIGVNVSDSDISISHRLPKSRASTRHGIQYDPPIIVKFVRRDVRYSYYKARSNLRNKTTNDLGIIGSSGQKIKRWSSLKHYTWSAGLKEKATQCQKPFEGKGKGTLNFEAKGKGTLTGKALPWHWPVDGICPFDRKCPVPSMAKARAL
jgi:hypothetical protein